MSGHHLQAKLSHARQNVKMGLSVTLDLFFGFLGGLLLVTTIGGSSDIGTFSWAASLMNSQQGLKFRGFL